MILLLWMSSLFRSCMAGSAPNSPQMASSADAANSTPLKVQLRMQQREIRRNEYIYNIFFWFSILLPVSIEVLWLRGGLASWMSSWLSLPLPLLFACESLLFVVCLVSLFLILFSILRISIESLSSPSLYSTADAASPEKAPSQSSKLHFSPPSWLASHHFGTPSPSQPTSASAQSSPSGRLFSPHAPSPLAGSLSNTSAASLRGPSPEHSCRAPFSSRIPTHSLARPMIGVHTEKQLEALLALNRSQTADGEENASSSILLFSGLLSSPSPQPFQLSRQPQPNKDDAFDLVQDERGSFHFSPTNAAAGPVGDEANRFRADFHQAIQNKKNQPTQLTSSSSSSPCAVVDGSSSARRRHVTRSSPLRSSSPSRPSSESRSDSSPARLSEDQLRIAEQNMRVWLANTVVKPVHEAIKAINHTLEAKSGMRVRVGTSSVEELNAFLAANPDLFSTTLPFLIPYLGTHSNQAYLVARIAQLASDPMIRHFEYASGGTQPVDDKNVIPSTSSAPSSHCRLLAHPWGEHLPTDTELLLSLFSCYMDGRITCTPLLYSHSVDQPFTARYLLRTPDKPSLSQQAPGSFYIHLSSLNPPQLELVSVSPAGSVSRKACTGRHGLFRVLVLFVHHSLIHNNGLIDRRSIGPNGINIQIVLDRTS